MAVNGAFMLFGLAFALITINVGAAASNCDADLLYPLEINITKIPKPLLIRKGEKFDVSASLKVRKHLPTKYKIDTELYKKYPFWVKLPCMSGAGSCDYTFDCAKMNCTQYLSMCTKCKITIEDLTVTVPMNIDFPSFLVNGHYWIGYKIYNGEDNSIIACGDKYFDIMI